MHIIYLPNIIWRGFHVAFPAKGLPNGSRTHQTQAPNSSPGKFLFVIHFQTVYTIQRQQKVPKMALRKICLPTIKVHFVSVANYVFSLISVVAVHPESRHVQQTFNNKGKLEFVHFYICWH